MLTTSKFRKITVYSKTTMRFFTKRDTNQRGQKRNTMNAGRTCSLNKGQKGSNISAAVGITPLQKGYRIRARSLRVQSDRPEKDCRGYKQPEPSHGLAHTQYHTQAEKAKIPRLRSGERGFGNRTISNALQAPQPSYSRALRHCDGVPRHSATALRYYDSV